MRPTPALLMSTWIAPKSAPIFAKICSTAEASLRSSTIGATAGDCLGDFRHPRIAIDQRELRAVLCERLRHGEADPRGRTGHDDDFSRKIPLH